MSDMKIAVSSYSFHAGKGIFIFTYKKIFKKAKEMGFKGVEIVDTMTGSQKSRLKKAEKLRCLSEKYSLPIVSFTFSADLLNGSGGDVKKEVERVCRKVDEAKAMNALRIRHDVVYSVKKETAYADILPRLINACREITEYAEKLNIKTCVENHGLYFQDIDKIESLINGVGNPNFEFLGDMGNFLCGDVDPLCAYKALSKYVGYVHAKDFYFSKSPKIGYFPTRNKNYLMGSVIGEGVVPVSDIIAELKAQNYSGYISIEFEGKGNPVLGIAKGKEFLEKLI